MTQDETKPTRRQFLTGATTLFASSLLPSGQGFGATVQRPLRSINVMNFLRAEEPRESMDLMLPVREQMRVIKANALPATWLLQYDALVEGPFVPFLKAEMPGHHEAGLWFEMNRRICNDAGIAWRGNPDWEWDYHVPVAYSIGYKPDERRKLADTAVATFRKVFGYTPRSVASWNLDAVSVEHLAEHHGVQAFGNCRDQLATDGFTIWGGALAGYYPSRRNAWSPATTASAQIDAPIFRLLGQDPVYYYDNTLPKPDTIEPVWASGRSRVFIDRFLHMIAGSPTGQFAYAQLGQENSFGWPEMQEAYRAQLAALARLCSNGDLRVETMSATGRRFRAAFATTPVQAQVMLQDPFGRTDPGERTVWYGSRFYRANLHMRGEEFYLRDLHVYDDRFEQPYLRDVVTEHGIEQRLLATLDGYHWSSHAPGTEGIRARGSFSVLTFGGAAQPLRMSGLPTVHESGNTLTVSIPLQSGGSFVARFCEEDLTMQLDGASNGARLRLAFEWEPLKTAFTHLSGRTMHYRFRGFDYTMRVTAGTAALAPRGVTVDALTASPLQLTLRQPAG